MFCPGAESGATRIHNDRVLSPEAMARIVGLTVRDVPPEALDGPSSASCGLLLVSTRLGCLERRWAIAEEVARHVMPGEDDGTVTRTAAALLMPRARFVSLVAGGFSLRHAAVSFGVSLCAAALRLGETIETPVAVSGISRWWTRGREYPWPSDAFSLRRFASRPPHGISAEVVQHTNERRLILIAA